MTYCVAIKTHAGLVFLSDSRTNAGLDMISTYRKMIIYEKPGERFMATRPLLLLLLSNHPTPGILGFNLGLSCDP